MTDPRTKMTLFVSGISELVDEESQTTLILKDMNFAQLVTFAEQIEEKKKGKMKKMDEAKRAKVEGGYQCNQGHHGGSDQTFNSDQRPQGVQLQ